MGSLGADSSPFARATAIMKRVAKTSPGAFVLADEDAGRVVVQNEMSVLVVENFPAAMPDISDHAPVEVELGIGLITLSLQVNLVVAGVGPFTPFYQIALWTPGTSSRSAGPSRAVSRSPPPARRRSGRARTARSSSGTRPTGPTSSSSSSAAGPTRRGSATTPGSWATAR